MVVLSPILSMYLINELPRSRTVRYQRFQLNPQVPLSLQERGVRCKLVLYHHIFRAGEFGVMGRASWFIILIMVISGSDIFQKRLRY